MTDKAAAFKERAEYFRQLAARDGGSRLRDDLLRAAAEWDALAEKVSARPAGPARAER